MISICKQFFWKTDTILMGPNGVMEYKVINELDGKIFREFGYGIDTVNLINQVEVPGMVGDIRIWVSETLREEITQIMEKAIL